MMAGRGHVIDPSCIHHEWDAALNPVLAVNSGDVVHYDLKVAGEGQIWPGASYPYNLSGPLWVNGATPGDTLEIEILELTPSSWGWTAFLPGLCCRRTFPTATCEPSISPRGRRPCSFPAWRSRSPRSSACSATIRASPDGSCPSRPTAAAGTWTTVI